MLGRIEKIKHTRPISSLFGKISEFIKEYAVLGVAIGVIVAQAGKDFVDALVKGFFIPLIQVIFSAENFSDLDFYVRGIRFNIGGIVSTLLTLLIVLVVLYFIVKKIVLHEERKR
ncbi:MAG TPA: MscL family protein [bacterium]|nr:MscL family protein [bacterium]HPT29408.1 MscL family protein [bacterium]